MTKRSMAAVGVALLLAAGCGPTEKDVAVVNGQKITEDELSQRMLSGPAARQVVQQMIVENVIMQQAKQKKISVTDAEVDQLMQWQKDQVPPGRFEEEVLKNTTEEALRNNLKVQIALRKMAMEGAKVTDESVTKFYNENKKVFVKPQWKQVGFIVPKNAADAKKAVEALKQGVDFEKAYQQFDSSPVKAENPEWQWFGITSTGIVSETRQPVNLPPALTAALKKTAKGQTSEPVVLEGDQRVIIKVNNESPGGQVPLEEVKPLIAFQVAQTNNEIKQPTEIIQQAVKDAKVEVKIDRFKDLEKPEELLGPQGQPGMPMQ